MKALSLSCNHCGAALSVPEKTNFVTCSYCSSRLKIQKEGGAVYSEVLEEVKEIADDVSIIKMQNRLERLDREWQKERETYMIRRKDGHVSEPSTGGNIIGFLFLIPFIGVCLFIAGSASKMGAPGIFSIVPVGIGVFAIVAAIFAMISGTGKSSKYQERKQLYEDKRRQLTKELGEV